jgi:UDP-glucose 4-epimerase
VKRKEFVVELSSGVVPFLGDINDSGVLAEACKGVDNVFHLAAIASEYKATTEEIMRVNVDGTRNVLEACEENGVQHFVFPSTLDVYGHRRKELLSEESRLIPKDRYGLSKVLAEQVIQRYSATVPSTIFRIATIYGRSGFEPPFFKVFKIIEEQKAYLIGNGQNKLSLINLYDVLQAMVLAKSNTISNGKIYNLTDGISYTQEYLFDLAADLLKVPRPSRHISALIVNLVAKRRGLDSDELRFLTSNRMVNISKVENELGYRSMVRIEDGTKELVDEFLNQKRGVPETKP